MTPRPVIGLVGVSRSVEGHLTARTADVARSARSGRGARWSGRAFQGPHHQGLGVGYLVGDLLAHVAGEFVVGPGERPALHDTRTYTDVYKWATKLGPAVPGGLLLDCFELARDIRTLDMQASPYDVTSYGLEPVAIETPEGKAQYVAQQRVFAERSNVLRARLLEVCAAL